MESVLVPNHTQIVAPGTIDTSHHRLRITATVCWKLFERCTKVSPSHLGRNYGKFKVWCGNLGVRQGGHASLDWRLKDDDTMENEVFSMLTDLEDDLQQVLELLSGTRPPYEQEESASEIASLSDSSLPGELEVRLDAIDATITALYQMSFLVRNQGTRRLASAKAQNYLPRDPEEAALLDSFLSFDRQHIDDLFRDLRRPRCDDGQLIASCSDPRSNGDSQDRAIKARCLAASTARRRQLAYWKMHSSKLKYIAAMPETAGLDQNATIYSGTEASGVFKRIENDFAHVEVQSLGSVASTVRDIDGHETEFPGPPDRSSDDDPFECPYCFVLCQPEEAGRHRWKKHILEDLRPYICTYPDCQDGTQLYGSRREWTAHEDEVHRSLRKSDADAPDKRMNTDDRTQCPICLLDVADLSGRTSLTKHLASHLERFSLDCLPLNTSSWGNENARDDESDSSDPDQSQTPALREDLARNMQDAAIENLEVKQTVDDVSKTLNVPDDRHRLRGAEKGVLAGDTTEDLVRSTRELVRSTEELIRSEMHRHLQQQELDFEKRQSMLDLIRKQVTEDHEFLKLDAESRTYQVNESWDNRPGDGSWDQIDEARRRIISEYERRQHELKERKDRAAAEHMTSRRESPEDETQEKGKAQDRTGHAEDKRQDRTNDRRRKQLEETGYTQSERDAIMDKEDEVKQHPASKAPKTAAPAAGNPTTPRAPVYPKVHTDHMATETLRYYDIPWEYDKSDSSYIIILRELDENETNILFDFTKRYREGAILLNDAGDFVMKGHYAYRQDKTKSRDAPDAEE